MDGPTSSAYSMVLIISAQKQVCPVCGHAAYESMCIVSRQLKRHVPPRLTWVIETAGSGRLVQSNDLKMTQYVWPVCVG